MAASHLTPPERIFQLPVTGRRNHHQRVVIGYTFVLDDEFTRDVLVHELWGLSGGYPARCRRNSETGPIRIKLHRVVFEHYHGPLPDGLLIDHEDRSPLNNLPSNLRAVTHSVNIANRNRQRNNRSGFNGVSWAKGKRQWEAYIKVMGKRIHLGRFPSAVQAARAVNAAYRIHFPQVAIPNPEAERDL